MLRFRDFPANFADRRPDHFRMVGEGFAPGRAACAFSTHCLLPTSGRRSLSLDRATWCHLLVTERLPPVSGVWGSPQAPKLLYHDISCCQQGYGLLAFQEQVAETPSAPRP